MRAILTEAQHREYIDDFIGAMENYRKNNQPENIKILWPYALDSVYVALESNHIILAVDYLMTLGEYNPSILEH